MHGNVLPYPFPLKAYLQAATRFSWAIEVVPLTDVIIDICTNLFSYILSAKPNNTSLEK